MELTKRRVPQCTALMTKWCTDNSRLLETHTEMWLLLVLYADPLYGNVRI